MAVTDVPKIVTARFGNEQSWTLRSYLDHGGYEGLRRAFSMSREDLVEQVNDLGVHAALRKGEEGVEKNPAVL